MSTEDEQLAVAENHALSNRYAILMNRLTESGSIDNKRPKAWYEYGYPEEITNDMLYNLYDRHGLAGGAVDLLRDTAWKSYPEVIEGDEAEENTKSTPWDKAVNKLAKKSKLWKAFKMADGYRMVIGWSALLLQYSDGQTWDKPVAKGVKVLRAVIPVWATKLTPGEVNIDEKSVYRHYRQ